MDNHDADLKLGKILLMLDSAVNRHEHVEFVLGGGQKRSVLKRIPTLLVDGGSFEITEEQLDTRIYAFVNENAHSRSWLFAKSSTVKTCSRVIGG